MKKAILVLLCCAIFSTTVSCNKDDVTNLHKENNDIKNNFVIEDQQTVQDIKVDNNIIPTNNQSMNFSNLKFYDMRSSYDSYYINRKPIAKYAVTDEQKFCVYIQEWDEYRIFPFNYAYENLVNCVNIYENNGILLNENYNETDTLNVLLFSKENNEIVEYNITLDRTVWLIGLFCGFTDENNGYIFVFEDVNDFTAVGGNRLAFLFKTQDGGETWSETTINNSPIVSGSDCTSLAEFIDENVGIISCRYSRAEDLCVRTFLTVDGGKTWEPIVTLPYEFDVRDGYATEIADISYIEGEYWLNVRVRGANDNTYYIQFKSLDLNSWMLVK